MGTCNIYNTSLDDKDDMTRLYKGYLFLIEHKLNKDIENGITT